MKRGQAFFSLLLAGTSVGIFGYVWTLPVVRDYGSEGQAPQLFWLVDSLGDAIGYIILGNLAVLLCWLGYSCWLAQATGRRMTQVLPEDAKSYLPLCLLIFPILQFHSLLTSHVEGVFLLSRSGAPLLLLLALLGVIYLKHRQFAPFSKARFQSHPSYQPGRTSKIAIFAVSLAVYIIFSSYATQNMGFGGDEPHYLLMTHSLLHDQDLKVRNNYNQEDYRAFYAHDLKPHLSIAKDGTRYPGHPIGLPFLLVPAYALDGHRGAVVFMNLLTALLAMQLFLVAADLTRRRWLAVLLWLLVSFTPPMLYYAAQIFPEVPSALLLIMALRLITPNWNGSRSRTRLQRRNGDMLWLAVILAVLPWIQQRMILPAMLLTGYHLSLVGNLRQVRHWSKSQVRRALIPVGGLVLSGLVMAGYYYLLYGNPLPNAPYLSVGIDTVFSWDIFLKEGLFGLLLDQEAGLLIYAPYFVFLFPGVLWLSRSRPKHAFWMLLIILSIYIPCGGFTLQWRGAWSPAARYMIALLPLFWLPCCLAVVRLRHDIYRLAFAALGILSLGWTALFWHDPMSAVMSRGGINQNFEHYSSVVDITRYFPAFNAEVTRHNLLVTGIWLLLLGVFTWRALKAMKQTEMLVTSPKSHDVQAVFRYYGLLLGIVMLGTFIIEQGGGGHKPLRVNTNRQRLDALHYLHAHPFAEVLTVQRQPVTPEHLTFAFINRERLGKVDASGPRHIAQGPWLSFPEGRYTALFKLAVSDNTQDVLVANLEATAGHGSLFFGAKRIRATDFEHPNHYELIPFSFDLMQDVSALETRVYFYNTIGLRVKRIYLTPDLAEFYYRAGALSLREGRKSDGKALLQRAIDRSDHPLAYYQLARLAQQEGRWEASKKLLERVIAQRPDCADALYRLGLATQELGDSETARRLFRQTVEYLPTHLDAWQALANSDDPQDAQQAQQKLDELYQPQHPYAINFGHQIMFLGYSLTNPQSGTLEIDYYWQALQPLTNDYVFFVHFTNGTRFQQDHFPQVPNPQTGELEVYPTRHWKVGELIHEHFTLNAPVGTFDIELGVWDTRERLPIITATPRRWFGPATTVRLERVTLH